MPPLTRQWRGPADLARDPAFLSRVAREFPAFAGVLDAPHDRRQVLRLLGAALALAGMGGCDDGEPGGVLIPPVIPARDAVIYGSNLYATASVLSGYATGVLVRHSLGRPIKVEGNPLHPASLGATDAIAQAEILGFYDPDRSAALTRDNTLQDWPTFQTALAALREELARTHGEGLRVLTGSITSPTLARQMAELHQHFPAMRWHQWEPVSRDPVRAGSMLAYGKPVEVVPRLDAADVIVAVDSDLISSAPGHVRLARDLAARRNPVHGPMSRIYAIEPTPTLIGVAADHRIVVGARDLPRVIAALADAILHNAPPSDAPPWLAGLVADLRSHPGKCFMHVGPHQPAESHALVHAMNEALGGRNSTYVLIDAVEAMPMDQARSLSELTQDMHAGRVTALTIIDSNPLFTAPSALGFADALQRVKFSLAQTIEPNETSRAAHWAVPQAHPYEDWSDARAFDGTATILQPQAEPLFGGTSPHRLLGFLLAHDPPEALEQVRQTWRDHDWHAALANGVLADTAFRPTDAKLRADVAQLDPPSPANGMTLLLRPDPHVWDGRFANNAWLQELPRPLTKLTWDNPLLISPEHARELGVGNGDHVTLSVGDFRRILPAWIVPGQAADCVVALLGFGRTVAGSVGAGIGIDCYPFAGRNGSVALHRTEGHSVLACTEHHSPLDARGDFARHGTFAEFQRDPRFLTDHAPTPGLYRRKPPGPAEWGMSIDLNACIGCNACVVACMAENNIPVVGREQVIREREMHWLRIDRYYEGDADTPAMIFQPVLCMHCEQAPCEVVCPVGATVHDSEGLNLMVYNRCIGTRFCSNNCPYKVRRFNYYGFSHEEPRPAVARNPDVTVRGRGVMEKCTFCLQRIAAARIEADIANRPVGGNEVRTACQAACPTQAFTFGNMAEADADVLGRKQSPLSYALLADQNTHPRVTYEAKVTNPNPKLKGTSA